MCISWKIKRMSARKIIFIVIALKPQTLGGISLFFSSPVSQQSNSDLDRLIVEVSRSHTIRHTSGWSLNEWSARYRGRNLNNAKQTQDNWTSVPSAGFKTAIPTTERLQTYALDSTATGIVWGFYISTATGIVWGFYMGLLDIPF